MACGALKKGELPREEKRNPPLQHSFAPLASYVYAAGLACNNSGEFCRGFSGAFLASHFVCRKMGKMLWKKCILKVFLLGFLADLIPAAILFALLFLLEGTPAEAFYSAAVTNPLSGAGSALIIFCAVLTASALIYVFDRFIAFKNTGLEKSQVHRLALFMAVLTAPWSFFIPAY